MSTTWIACNMEESGLKGVKTTRKCGAFHVDCTYKLREEFVKTIIMYGNCFRNSNCPVTINSMFNECSAVHLHSNTKVI